MIVFNTRTLADIIWHVDTLTLTEIGQFIIDYIEHEKEKDPNIIIDKHIYAEALESWASQNMCEDKVRHLD